MKKPTGPVTAAELEALEKAADAGRKTVRAYLRDGEGTEAQARKGLAAVNALTVARQLLVKHMAAGKRRATNLRKKGYRPVSEQLAEAHAILKQYGERKDKPRGH